MSVAARLKATSTRTRLAVADEIAPLTHPSAFSWRVALVFVPIAAISQVVSDTENAGTPIVDWLTPTIAGVVAFLIVFAALRHLSRHRLLSPEQVILCFALAGTARSLTVGGVTLALGLSDSMEWAYRMTGGMLLSPALLGVIAGTVARHDTHLAIVTELQGQRDHLLDVGQSMDDALARTEDEITMAVRAAIEPALTALDTVLDQVTTDASSQTAVMALVGLVDNEVRPISHRLTTQTRYAPASIDRARHPRRVRVPLPRRVAIVEGIRPVIAAMLFFSVSGPTVFRHAAFDTAVIRLTQGALLSWTVLSLVKVLLRPMRTAAAPAVVIVAGVHVLAAMFVVPVMQGSWLPIGDGGRIAGLQLAAVVGAMTAIAVVVDARRAATQSELVRVVAELNTVIEMMGRRARLARTRLAHVLHGSLQGALHAAAIRLSEAPRPDASLVQAIRDDIAVALERIDDRTWGGATLQHTLDEIVAIWSGHRDLTVNLPAEVAAVLANDRDADSAAAEVVREAVNNALRHGRAQSVDIDVRVVDESDATNSRSRHARITVTDDGSGWSDDSPHGLGSILFDDLCASWHHADTGSGTCFVATVGLLPLASDRAAT